MKPDDNFFDFGGHSLLATRIIGTLQSKHGIQIRFNDFFEAPTAAALAARATVSEQGRQAAPSAEVRQAPLALAQASRCGAPTPPTTSAPSSTCPSRWTSSIRWTKTCSAWPSATCWNATPACAPPSMNKTAPRCSASCRWRKPAATNGSGAARRARADAGGRSRPSLRPGPRTAAADTLPAPSGHRPPNPVLPGASHGDRRMVAQCDDGRAGAGLSRPRRRPGATMGRPAPSFHAFALEQQRQGVNPRHMDYWTAMLRGAHRAYNCRTRPRRPPRPPRPPASRPNGWSSSPSRARRKRSPPSPSVTIPHCSAWSTPPSRWRCISWAICRKS